jgi:hypothetical protein
VLDDDGDIDNNGIPDSIQRDPVVAPGDPVPFNMFEPDAGLPGIDSPSEATAEPVPEVPVEPTPPPPDADEATLATYQADLARYNRMFEMYSKIMSNAHEMKKSIIDNIRG